MILFVPKDVQQKRLAACTFCPSRRSSPIAHCGECGCPIASKTRVANTACPLNKWGPYTGA